MHHKTRKKHQKFIYKAGDVFGRLTLTGLTYTKQSHGTWRRIVEAVCMCGVVKDYIFQSLSNGDTQSCGCYRKEVTKKMATKHALCGDRIFDVWQNIRSRCYNVNNDQYKDYGGRGIEMWADWRNDFYSFYEWCIANGHDEKLTLDRIDNDGDYAPHNLRFATRAIQSRNTRRNRMCTAFGETKCLQDWAKDDRCKLSVHGLFNRVNRKSGRWDDFEKALTTPALSNMEQAQFRKSSKNLTAFGDTKCMAQWIKDPRCAVKLDCLRSRIEKGWEHEKAISHPPKSNLTKI